VRQIRGTSCNQVTGVEHVLVTAGTGCPTSGSCSDAPKRARRRRRTAMPTANDSWDQAPRA
jgi:hypothetical protein